jgi:hypothetical protein
MSLAEVQQVYQLLEKINDRLAEIDARTEAVGVRVRSISLRNELRELEYLSFRVVSILGRLGLPPEIDKAVQVIQRLILAIRMLQTATAWLLVATPTGYTQAMGIIGLIGSAMSFGDAALEGFRGVSA